MNKESVENDLGCNYLAAYMQRVIEQLKLEDKFSAAKLYKSALHSYQNFAGGKDVLLPMNEVFTPERLKAYERWLTQEKPKPLKPNSVTSYMSILRAVYNRWMPVGTPDYNPKLFADISIRVVAKTKRALREWQMEKLLNAEVSSLSRGQEQALNYFCLMFLCRGMPFIDLAHLRKTDLQGDYLVYLRHKTGVPMKIRLNAHALRLIRKLSKNNPDSPYLLPILDAKVTGRQKQYTHYQDALRNFNKTLARVMKKLLPGVKVSSYTARHTWATIAYHIGVPVGLISQSLGHSSISVTITYLKPFDDEKVDKVNTQVISFAKKCKWRSQRMINSL